MFLLVNVICSLFGHALLDVSIVLRMRQLVAWIRQCPPQAWDASSVAVDEGVSLTQPRLKIVTGGDMESVSDAGEAIDNQRAYAHRRCVQERCDPTSDVTPCMLAGACFQSSLSISSASRAVKERLRRASLIIQLAWPTTCGSACA